MAMGHFSIAARLRSWRRLVMRSEQTLRYLMTMRHEMDVIRASMLPRYEGEPLTPDDVRYYARECIDTIRFYRERIKRYAPHALPKEVAKKTRTQSELQVRARLSDAYHRRHRGGFTDRLLARLEVRLHVSTLRIMQTAHTRLDTAFKRFERSVKGTFPGAHTI
jgi:hypothetical protein